MRIWIFIFLVFLAPVSNAKSADEPIHEALTGIGAKVDLIELTDVQEQKVSFADLKGQDTVVYFFASWCAPCYKTLQSIESVQNNYERTTKVIAVALEKDRKAVQAMLDKTGFTGEVWYSVNGAMPLKERKFDNQRRALPYTIKINAKNILVEKSYKLRKEEHWKNVLVDQKTFIVAVKT